jgi:hypothetical protein
MMKHVERSPTIMYLDGELLVVRAVRHGYEQPIVWGEPREANVEAIA